jgi:hypothetical protein
MIRVKIVDFEYFESREYDTYNAAGLASHMLELARLGYLYETGESWDACIALASEDVSLPDPVSDALYRFWADTDHKTYVYEHEGIEYLFVRAHE